MSVKLRPGSFVLMLITNVDGNEILGRSISSCFCVMVALGESLSNIWALYAVAYISVKKTLLEEKCLWRKGPFIFEIGYEVVYYTSRLVY